MAFVQITVADYEPVYDSNLSMDTLIVAPGFGVDAVTGIAYYDTAGPTRGEHASFGIVAPFDMVLDTQ